MQGVGQKGELEKLQWDILKVRLMGVREILPRDWLSARGLANLVYNKSIYVIG